MPGLHDFEAQTIDGQTVSLQQFKGKPLLITLKGRVEVYYR